MYRFIWEAEEKLDSTEITEITNALMSEMEKIGARYEQLSTKLTSSKDKNTILSILKKIADKIASIANTYGKKIVYVTLVAVLLGVFYLIFKKKKHDSLDESMLYTEGDEESESNIIINFVNKNFKKIKSFCEKYEKKVASLIKDFSRKVNEADIPIPTVSPAILAIGSVFGMIIHLYIALKLSAYLYGPGKSIKEFLVAVGRRLKYEFTHPLLLGAKFLIFISLSLFAASFSTFLTSLEAL
ncbi:MAG: hypothetical protein QXP36_09330 [Conexivisphaerales archaeon]